MDAYEKIYEEITKMSFFNNTSYRKLTNKFNKDDVVNAIRKLLRERNENLELYNKIIGNGNSNCNLVINKFLLVRMSELRDRINDFIKKTDFDYEAYNKMIISDKVNYVLETETDINILEEIRELYNEFLIIRNRICNYYLYLIDSVMKKYRECDNYSELYQEGFMGLLYACEIFIPGKIVFEKFAIININWKVIEHFHDYDFIYCFPRKFTEFYYLLKEYDDIQNVSLDEIASRLGISLKIAAKMLMMMGENDSVSFNSELITEDEEMLSDEIIMVDKDIRTIEDSVVKRELIDDLKEALGKLTNRQRAIVQAKFLGNSVLTNEDTARIFNVTQQNIGCVTKFAFQRIRKRKPELKEYL